MSILGLVGGNPFIALLAALTAANGKKTGSNGKKNGEKIKPDMHNDYKKHEEHKEAYSKDKDKQREKTDEKGDIKSDKAIAKDKKKDIDKVKNELSVKKHDSKTKEIAKSDSFKKETDDLKHYTDLETLLNLRYKDIEMLSEKDLHFMGKKLIAAGVLLQENLSQLMKAESTKLSKSIIKLENSKDEAITVQDLHKINKSLSKTLSYVAQIEDKIIEKIRLGERLVHENPPIKNHASNVPSTESVENRNIRDDGNKDD